jgi:hypothetical protein
VEVRSLQLLLSLWHGALVVIGALVVNRLTGVEMNEPFLDFYRCPENFGTFALSAELRNEPGYFRFGDDLICFGQCSPGYSSRVPGSRLYDSDQEVSCNHSSVRLPFDLAQVINNLRLERYVTRSNKTSLWRVIRDSYYSARPFLGVSLRKHLQRFYFRGWDKIPFPRWPVDTTVEQLFEKLMYLMLKAQKVDAIPFIWFWPEGASSCVMMTHDVETGVGAAFCPYLMDIDDEWGLKASFQVVPEKRYSVTEQLLESIRQRGFEFNVQDLNHDGLLFKDQKSFLKRAEAINRYARTYGSRGFRAGAMYRNLDWYEALDISYDMSVPNVAHLEPQRGGCCTVFPYFIGKILELPLTTTQDYSLFHILNDYSIELWKRQIRLIQQRHGLASFIIHPDYIIPERARDIYLALLEHLAQLRKEGRTWFALPGEVDRWWRERSQMKLVHQGGTWVIEGPGKERARVAYAMLDADGLLYISDSPGKASRSHQSHSGLRRGGPQSPQVLVPRSGTR